MTTKKNILVTGGAGFVGSNLIKRLVEIPDIQVIATYYHRKPPIQDPRVTYVWAELQNPDFCECICVDNIEKIFLCAANTSGAAVMERTPLAHLTPNIIMNSLMLEAAYQAGVSQVLFISSNTVYPETNYPVSEEDTNYEFYHKYFIVGWMKRFTELMCEMYSTKIKNPMKTVIVRPANIYGPMDDFEWETSHVIPATIRKVVERHDPIKVWGDGSDVKDFIYIDDFIDGMLLASDYMDASDHMFEVFNIASGNGYRLRDLLQLMLKIDGYDNAPIEYDTTKPTMIPKRLISTKKAERVLGFKIKTPVTEGLRKTIEWYRSTR